MSIRSLAATLITLVPLACARDATGPTTEQDWRVAVANFGLQRPITILDRTGGIFAVISCGQSCELDEPQWSRSGTMLAMLGKRDSTSVLFVANADGTGLHEVATAPAQRLPGSHGTTFLGFPSFDQSWSSDDRLAYVKSNRIETVKADGTDRRTVLTGSPVIRLPRWAPGDTAITFFSGSGQSLSLMSVRPDGSKQSEVVRLSADLPSYAWAPDGSAIAMKSYDPNTVISQLWRVDAKSLQPTLVTSLYSAGGFCWSPDSQGLSFTGNSGVYVVRLGQPGLTPVASVPSYINTAAGWTPDGRSLLFKWEGINDNIRLYLVTPPDSAKHAFNPLPGVSTFSVSGSSCG